MNITNAIEIFKNLKSRVASVKLKASDGDEQAHEKGKEIRDDLMFALQSLADLIGVKHVTMVIVPDEKDVDESGNRIRALIASSQLIASMTEYEIDSHGETFTRAAETLAEAKAARYLKKRDGSETSNRIEWLLNELYGSLPDELISSVNKTESTDSNSDDRQETTRIKKPGRC